MRLRKRLPSDMPQVLSLLAQAGLPAEGLDQTSGWVVEMEASVVGHVAIEPTTDAVVIRSLAVDPSRRGHGLGERLMAIAEAASEGRVLVLRTDTVGPWMLRRGYWIAPLSEVPASVRSTTQFSGSLCASTPVYLRPPAQPTPDRATHGNGSSASLKGNTVGSDTLKAAVRDRYTGFVTRNQGCCGPRSACGCSGRIKDAGPERGAPPVLFDRDAPPDSPPIAPGQSPAAASSLAVGYALQDM